MDNSWITAILALFFIASTNPPKTEENEAQKEPFWRYLFFAFLVPQIALIVFSYMLFRDRKRPRSFYYIFLYSLLATITMLFHLL